MVIFYKKSYKYKLTSSTRIQIDIKDFQINHEYYSLDLSGGLIVNKDYCWDGATMFPDIKSIMKASLVHDCLYQMIRLNQLPQSKRDEADKILKKICVESGMNNILANIVYFAVRIFGRISIKNSAPKSILSAP